MVLERRPHLVRQQSRSTCSVHPGTAESDALYPAAAMPASASSNEYEW
jgi:hypothetical protein